MVNSQFRSEVSVTISCTPEVYGWDHEEAAQKIQSMTLDELIEEGFTVKSVEIEELEDITASGIFGIG